METLKCVLCKSLSSQQDFLFFLVFLGGRETNIIDPFAKSKKQLQSQDQGTTPKGIWGRKPLTQQPETRIVGNTIELLSRCF